MLSRVLKDKWQSGQKKPPNRQTKQKHSKNNSGAARQWNKPLNLQHRSRAEIFNLLFIDSCPVRTVILGSKEQSDWRRVKYCMTGETRQDE